MSATERTKDKAMSLNFDYGKCDQTLLTDEHYERWTEYVVFHTMFVGMPEITEINWSQFVMRCIMFEASCGHQTYSTAELSAAVRPYIGLRTNVSPMTDAAFVKKLKERQESTMRSIRMGAEVNV